MRGPYGKPKIVAIPKADHNLTTAEAREAWTLELKTLALQLPPKPQDRFTVGEESGHRGAVTWRDLKRKARHLI